MRILTLTTLYPHGAAPTHGVFVENRLFAFKAKSGAEIRVVAPVPWFPLKEHWAGPYARYAAAPAREERRGIAIEHPRYFLPPKVGMTVAAHALERSFHRAAKRLMESGWNPDVIDAHYLYPDGVAAVRAARRLGKPVIVTARGSDVTLLPRFPRQRRMILEALRGADAVVAVAASLKEELVRLGAPAEKIVVLRNGVDLQRFRPLDREKLRRDMALSGSVIASVGHLIERKGHHRVIEALAALSHGTLLIAGEGPEEKTLRRLAAVMGLGERVRFLGPVAHEELCAVYNVADALVLASSREGWANVLLEAIACGTPVVATPAGAAPEIVAAPEAGILAKDFSAGAVADALKTLLATPPSRRDTRAVAERFSWDETSDGLNTLFADAVARRARRGAVRTRPVSFARPRTGVLLTVDTEEAFDWSRPGGSAGAVTPPEDLERFQALAASYGARPLYLLTLPVIEEARAAAWFRRLAETGAADLGVHLHTWNTPPLAGYEDEYYSWQSNLPDEMHRLKLAALAAAFESAFGFRPRAHRAGRYGIAPENYADLAALGLDFDFSPSPGFDFSAAGGPDFSAMRAGPFIAETAAGPVFTTPVSGARALKGGRLFLPPPAAEPGFASRRPRFPRALTAPARLTCEGMSDRDLAALTRRLVRDGAPILTFSLHATSLTPGANPYARDEAAVEAMLETCRKYFHFVKNGPGADFLHLDDLAAIYGAPAPLCLTAH